MDEKRDLLKQLSDQSDAIIKHSDSKNPEKTWMYRVTQGFWNELYQARETGRPIILCSPNVPQEMIYSLGAVPLPVDALPTRLASSKDAWRYIDISEQYVPTTVCSINKVNFGTVFSGDLGFIPRQWYIALSLATLPEALTPQWQSTLTRPMAFLTS